MRCRSRDCLRLSSPVCGIPVIMATVVSSSVPSGSNTASQVTGAPMESGFSCMTTRASQSCTGRTRSPAFPFDRLLDRCAAVGRRVFARLVVAVQVTCSWILVMAGPLPDARVVLAVEHEVLVEENAVADVTGGGEAGVVDVVEVAAGDGVAAGVGAPTVAPGLVVTAVRQQFLTDATVLGHPHPDVRV